MLGLPDERAGVPVRPRRRADPDRQGARGRLEGDVRRVPARRAARRRGFVPFDADADYDSTSTASRAPTACAPSSRRAGSSCRRAKPDDPPERGDRPRARQPQERDRAAADPRARGRGLRGLGALRARRRARPGCAGPSSRRAPTAATCWWPPASRTCSRCASTASSRSASTCKGKPAPDTFLAGARALGVTPDAGGGLRGRAGRRRGRARRRLRPAWSASTASGQADALREHGADVVVRDLAELLADR